MLQFIQELDAVVLNIPEEQIKQFDDDSAPVSGPYVPPGQTKQLVEPSSGRNLPEAQLVHIDAVAAE